MAPEDHEIGQARGEEPEAPKSNIIHPARPLHRKYVQPILYLAERMSVADGQLAGSERRTIDLLAERAKIKDFRKQKWYRDLNEKEACRQLDIETARNGAMVVMTLVLKVDVKKHPGEHAFFTRIRTQLGSPHIVVPVDLDAHTKLAMEYVGG
jgi:hypothetical protein